MKNLYIHSSGQSDMENDAFGVRLLYQKVFEAMTSAQRAELQRLCENEITQGTMKFSVLLKNVAQASRKISITNVSLSSLNLQRNNTVPRETQPESLIPTTANYSSQEERHKCFYCREIGDIAKDCYGKRKRQLSKRTRKTTKSIRSTATGQRTDEPAISTKHIGKKRR